MNETLLMRRIQLLEEVLAALLLNSGNPHEAQTLGDIDDSMYKARQMLDEGLSEVNQINAKIG